LERESESEREKRMIRMNGGEKGMRETFEGHGELGGPRVEKWVPTTRGLCTLVE
jgi:hypothetical protein